MKRMKKLFALLLALAMIMGISTTAFAAKITIDDGTNIEGATYVAYKLLNATNDGDKYAYTVNSTYKTILQEVTGKTTDSDIIEYISELKDECIRTFADTVYAKVKDMTADETASENVFSDIEQGYYLIVEKELGNTSEGMGSDTYSLVMLDTAGDKEITVETKEDLPTVEKKVQEKNESTGDSSWGDSADYGIGETINYEITGTVSNKYANYKSYDYKFSDTMTDGLTLDQSSIKIMIGEIDVTKQFEIDTTTHSFTAYANLKKLKNVTITGSTEIIVTYTASLNENAISGTTGNQNEVSLYYENNPYHKGDGEPEGETPKDTNVVFTYNAIVNKVDDDEQPLKGAGFTLYKWNNEKNDWVAVGDEITGVTTFGFYKIDEGQYKLVETTVPDGYNKADDIIFTVESTLSGTGLKNLVVKDVTGATVDDFTVTLASGNVETSVVNNAGTILPSTGGMGTTLFYVFGSILVLAAVVLLVTKKRMSDAE